MKLICEVNEEIETLVEAKGEGSNKDYFIKGVFLQAEQKNRNGRIYPMETMAKEVDRYSKQYVDTNRAFGELGHPDGPTINLERVSHMIKELKQDGPNFVGKAKVMETPYGKIVKIKKLKTILLKNLLRKQKMRAYIFLLLNVFYQNFNFINIHSNKYSFRRL